jgi:hypothetical protein
MQANKPTSKRGGKRQNAGRKPSPFPHVRINIYISQPDLAQLKAINKSPSQAVRQLLKEKQK